MKHEEGSVSCLTNDKCSKFKHIPKPLKMSTYYERQKKVPKYFSNITTYIFFLYFHFT